MVELPESAAHVATDPNRVYYVGAGYNPCHAPGAPLFLTRPCLRPCPFLRTACNMLDGLRQGLVSPFFRIPRRAAGLPLVKSGAGAGVSVSQPRLYSREQFVAREGFW